MKIFALAVGDRHRASSRLRLWDHLDWLRTQGHEVRSDFVMLPGVHKVTIGAAWRLILRWPYWAWQFLSADRILIQEALLLWPLLGIKRYGKARKVVFDFSDPVDTIGSGLRNRLQRLFFSAMIHGADHVVVENAIYLAELSSEGIATSQFFGPVDVERYQASAHSQPPRDKSVLRIGWTGSPSTLCYIKPLFPVLDQLAAVHRIELMLVGVTSVDYGFQNLEVLVRQWTEKAEIELVPSFDIGLFMLDDSERSKRRGAGKLFIYMAAGVPFIATDLGIAKELLRLAPVGYPVEELSLWYEALLYLVNAREDRRRMSAAAVSYAIRQMSYATYRQHLTNVLSLLKE